MVPLTHPEQNLPLEVSVIVTQRNDLPCIEIRKVTTDLDLMKGIVSCAFHGRPLVIMPRFKDQMRSISALIKKGLVYRDTETDTYRWNI